MYTVNVVVSLKQCKIETLLLQTTNRKLYTANQIAAIPMTLSDLQGHLPIASFFKWDFSYTISRHYSRSTLSAVKIAPEPSDHIE